MSEMTQKEYRDLLDQDPFFTLKEKDSKLGVGNHGKTIEYLPIQSIRKTLESIYGQYSQEVRNVTKDGNLIVVTARINLVHPVTKEHFFMDGVGARSYKMTDTYNISHAQGMQNAPNAYTYAIKNACQPLGRVFGRDLNDTKGVVGQTTTNIKNTVKLKDLDTLEKLAEAGKAAKEADPTIYKLIVSRYKMLKGVFDVGVDCEEKCIEYGFDFKTSYKEWEDLNVEK